AVEKVLFGEEEHDKFRKQKLIIQGLVPVSPGKESITERYFKNKACMKFHKRIWTLRCEAVAKWEELSKWNKRKEKKKKQ
ncbi:23555_t:CDS:1, partial [Gigaspora rosea]